MSNYVPIPEPVDYEKLAQAYKTARWKLWDVFPSADSLRSLVVRLLAYQKSGVSSGGIEIRLEPDGHTVCVKDRLAKHYFDKS